MPDTKQQTRQNEVRSARSQEELSLAVQKELLEKALR